MNLPLPLELLWLLSLTRLGLWAAVSHNREPRDIGAAGGNQSIGHNLFATDFYGAVAKSHLSENVVVSPAAVQILMALMYYGSKGKTATELARGIRLEPTDNTQDLLSHYSRYWQSFARDSSIKSFNAIYVNENLEYKGKFKEQAKHFDATIEKTDFHPPYNKRTADRINKAVETKTNGKITNLIDAQQMDDLTEGVVLNAISFKSNWLKSFRPEQTEKRAFSDGGRLSYKVDTMATVDNILYGEISPLNAKAIELPFENPEFVMILLLPNRKDGLRDLVERLKGKNLISLLGTGGVMSRQKVGVLLPKFKVQQRVSLQEAFKELGVTTMFTREGDFGEMYRMFVSHYINSANHGVQLEINEDGQQLAADNSAGGKDQTNTAGKLFVVCFYG